MRQRRKQLTAKLPAYFVVTADKRATDATQAFREHFRVHAHADAEVVRHFEEAARNRRGFEFDSQPFRKISALPFRNRTNEVVPQSVCTAESAGCCAKKSRSNLRSASTMSACPFAKQIQVLECHDAEKLAWINRRCGIEIIQALHLPGEIGMRQDPSAAQSADAINFSQTAGH